MENDDFNLKLLAIKHNCCTDTHTFDRLRVGHFVAKHNKMCSLPYAMTANKTYLSTYFPFKTSLFIKRMSLINKVNFKKCFSENYKRMRLTTRVYGNSLTTTKYIEYINSTACVTLFVALVKFYCDVITEAVYSFDQHLL